MSEPIQRPVPVALATRDEQTLTAIRDKARALYMALADYRSSAVMEPPVRDAVRDSMSETLEIIERIGDLVQTRKESAT